MATLPVCEDNSTFPLNLRLLSTLQGIIQVPEKLLISEWAEKYRVLPSEEAISGEFRFQNSPWTREITDRLHPSDPATDVVFMKSRQVGGTEIAVNALGYYVDRHPVRFTYVMPSLDSARKIARERIHNMFLMCPTLREKVATRRSSKGASTLLQRDFVGGSVNITTAGSEVALRSSASPVFIFDEVDAYELSVQNRGDPVEIAKRAAESFGWRRKFFYVSTPLDEQVSRVEPLFRESDMNYFHVPCLQCGVLQRLVWAQVKYDKLSPNAGLYECPHCEQRWPEGMRVQATRQGQWVASRQWHRHMPRGYHINAVYSHQVRMGDLVIEWLKAQNNVEGLIAFTTNRLAETWKDQSIYLHQPESLMGRREHYRHSAPHGVQVITSGVDVQDDRIEIGIYGWGAGEECWALGHSVLYGETTGNEVWAELSQLLMISFPSPLGEMRINAVGIDTGHQSQKVYDFCLRRDDGRTHRVWPIKGDSSLNDPIWKNPPVRNKLKKQRPYIVNTFIAKKNLYHNLTNQPGGPSTIHFPIADWCDDNYFHQLTAETLRRTSRQGRVKQEWVIRRGHERNEVLDCFVYAYATLKGLLRSGRFRFQEQYDIAFAEQLDQNKTAGHKTSVQTPLSEPKPTPGVSGERTPSTPDAKSPENRQIAPESRQQFPAQRQPRPQGRFVGRRGRDR